MTTYLEIIYAWEAARLLGIEPRRIKQLVRDHHLFTIPLPEGRQAIPQEIPVKAADGWESLFSPPGTLALLADGGFTEDEVAVWLYTEHDELKETPMKVMFAGRYHRVNVTVSTLAL